MSFRWLFVPLQYTRGIPIHHPLDVSDGDYKVSQMILFLMLFLMDAASNHKNDY